jgi:hypothetical protein
MRSLAIASVAASVAACVAAAAQGSGARTWDFQSDALDSPPTGFSFGRTGRGREGKWVVVRDPTAPSGDHVLAQVDGDDTDYRFPVAVADAPGVTDLRVEVRCKPILDARDDTFKDAGKAGVWTKADSVTYFDALTVAPLR